MTAPTSAPASSSQQWDLVGRLQRLAIPEREDRAALAALRRSLGKEPGYSADVARIVQPALKDDAPPAEAEAYYLVASLFGLLPRHFDTPRDPSPPWAQQGLGWSLRRARLRDDGEADPGVERRFVALLDSRPEALGEHLRHLIKLAMSRDDGFALDYRKLLRDILDWDHPEHRVQRQWAAGFWSGGQSTAAGEDADPINDDANDAATDDGDDE